MRKEGKEILSSLQAGRAVAAIIVVCFHARFLFQELYPTWNQSFLFHFFNFGRAGVQFFFVLSGFIILNIHWGDLNDPSRLIPYLKKRFIRIYPILWVVLTGAAILYFYSSSFVYPLYHRDPLVLLSSSLLVHFDSSKHVAIDVIWTLYHEVLFYALFSIAIFHKKLGGIILTLWLVGSVIALGFEKVPFPLSFLFSSYHLLFGLGLLACILLRKGYFPFPLLLTLLGFVTFGGAAAAETQFFGYVTQMTNDSLYGIGSFLILVGTIALERQGRLKFPQWLVVMGNASYVIYLIHFTAIQFFIRYLHVFSVLPPVISFFLLIVTAVCSGLIIHLVIEKPLLSFMRKIAFSSPSGKP